ncbi:transposase [Nonomuraea sp. 10N515B]
MGADRAALWRQPRRGVGNAVHSRNGYHRREWDTRTGTVEAAIPKLRTCS